jgi:hypothetical protein
LARPEPFRALLEEAYESEGKKAPTAPVPLERRLDQVMLAGVTPAHGIRVPASVRALRQETPMSSPSAPPVETSASTRDLLDALDADITSPSHKPRPVSALSPKHELKSAAPPADVPAPMNFPRPPPLPKRGPALKAKAPAPVVVPAQGPAPVRVADRAPPPRISALLDDTNPSLRDSSSSGSGKIADLYRLQLEFEDTPARPLPRNASLPPLPVDDRVTQPMPQDALHALARGNRRSFEFSSPSALSDEVAPLHEGEHRLADGHLIDEDGIADLDALARAMGLRGIGDVSIPSLDGQPVADDASLDDIPTLTTGPLSEEARRARVLEALGEGKESVFVSKEGEPVDDTRPALQAATTAKPVIVKIPARPRVSAENRERARRLYLTAVDALAKADRVGAIGQLRLAMEIDDGNPLYPELLRQLEKQIAERAAGAPRPQPRARTGEGPALMVASTSGSLRRPQEFVRFRE